MRNNRQSIYTRLVLCLLLIGAYSSHAQKPAKSAPEMDMGERYKEVPESKEQEERGRNGEKGQGSNQRDTGHPVNIEQPDKKVYDLGERYKETLGPSEQENGKKNDHREPVQAVPNRMRDISDSSTDPPTPILYNHISIYNPYERSFKFLLIRLPKDSTYVTLAGNKDMVLPLNSAYELITDPKNKKCRSSLLPNTKYALKYDEVVKCYLAEKR
jgi:hypothetical protein